MHAMVMVIWVPNMLNILKARLNIYIEVFLHFKVESSKSIFYEVSYCFSFACAFPQVYLRFQFPLSSVDTYLCDTVVNFETYMRNITVFCVHLGRIYTLRENK